MKNLLKFCSITETSTALALIFIPAIITQLLIGTELNDLALLLTRFSGICLLSLGIACWPKQETVQASWAMILYNILVTIFFIYIGLNQTWVGILLWPGVVLHFVLAVLLIRGLLVEKKSR